MAKKSMIARDVKRKKTVERYAWRAALMAAFNAAEIRWIAGDPSQDSGSASQQRIRVRNRCWATGKPATFIAISVFAATSCVSALRGRGGQVHW